jgi:thiosulfate reductase cytochrome b subunit
LKTKIEQLLTEARLIIPGAQALFGFQFIAMLTTGFDRLPNSAKTVHAAALCLIGLNVIIMMTPAALHRLSFGGEDSLRFLRMGSALVIAGPAFLAAGMAAEIYVVFIKALNSPAAASSASIAALLILVGFWYVWPLALRARRN